MIEVVITYFSGTLGLVELAGTVASAICVYLAIKQNIWTWFWGAIGVLFFGYLFFQFNLYSDAGLQILFFLPCQVFGWYWWMKCGPKANDDLPVTTVKIETRWKIIIGILLVSAINGYLMFTYTDASFPYIDALTTWMSIAAQILMIKKIWESWILWISMDIIAIFVYAAKGLAVTSGLYVVFLFLAIMGGIAWYRQIGKERNVL